MTGLLRQPRALSAAGLAILCMLAWLYILGGAGTGMSAWQMTNATLFPYRAAVPMPDMPGMDMSGMDMSGMEVPKPNMGPAAVGLLLAMWWVMMIAMMLPGAAPAILLYAGARRHGLHRGEAAVGLAPTGVFAAGYLLVWLLFSAVATTLQLMLVNAGVVSAQTMASQNRVLSAALLLVAGAYQLSPLKHTCLAHCRSPVAFITQHWRPGTAGALRLGVLHGAWCVGCCWLLMALLFVGGVMNVVWIAALALLVLVEKLVPAGPWVGRITGLLLIAWGVATLLV